jgi:hypothetical protein
LKYLQQRLTPVILFTFHSSLGIATVITEGPFCCPVTQGINAVTAAIAGFADNSLPMEMNLRRENDFLTLVADNKLIIRHFLK